ncbi:MAG: hypothetical protein NUW24_16955, partial [Anaerolineae bacterium]|nr:hypothetical protein [Anaerolineae bacterium]
DLHDDGARFGPVAGVAHVVRGPRTEGVEAPNLARVHGLGILGVRQPGGPVAAVHAVLHVVGGCAGTPLQLPPPLRLRSGQAAGGVPRRGEGGTSRCARGWLSPKMLSGLPSACVRGDETLGEDAQPTRY